MTRPTQADRWARREPLGVLLSRAERGVLLPAEGPLLRAAVEAELEDAEEAHALLERYEAVIAAVAVKAHEWADRYDWASTRVDAVLAEAGKLLIALMAADGPQSAPEPPDVPEPRQTADSPPGASQETADGPTP